MHAIYTTQPVIDLSDVWEQYSDIRSEFETEHEEYLDEGGTKDLIHWMSDLKGREEDLDRHRELKALVQELERYGMRAEDLAEGTLVHDQHIGVWVRDHYMESLPVPDKTWSELPFCHIDWEAVAKDRCSDYSIIEWEGETFYLVEDN